MVRSLAETAYQLGLVRQAATVVRAWVTGLPMRCWHLCAGPAELLEVHDQGRPLVRIDPVRMVFHEQVGMHADALDPQLVQVREAAQRVAVGRYPGQSRAARACLSRLSCLYWRYRISPIVADASHRMALAASTPTFTRTRTLTSCMAVPVIGSVTAANVAPNVTMHGCLSGFLSGISVWHPDGMPGRPLPPWCRTVRGRALRRRQRVPAQGAGGGGRGHDAGPARRHPGRQCRRARRFRNPRPAATAGRRSQ